MQGAGVPLLLLGGGGYSTPDTGSDCDWEDLFDGLPCCDGRTLVYVSVYISFLPALRRMFPPRLLLLLVLLFVLFYFILCVCVCVCVCACVCVFAFPARAWAAATAAAVEVSRSGVYTNTLLPENGLSV